ncbi:F510_1955 family glycosylhydrolase [Laceyella putida]|uniref:F510_1955 family glycosylhydrolase n=1 Tax=Laceyella putida TaxID=110101 RepID=A0ABW2RLA6_9BACL
MFRLKMAAFLLISSLLFLSACSGTKETTFSAEHIHGFSYTADGKQLLTATHDGLYAYANGKWSGPIGEPQDLMGFSLTEKGIFSSGHPAPDSDKTNPLGLVQSVDNGETWKTIGFEGESDFHNMTAGFKTGAIYILNEQPNSKMGTGLYMSKDSGKTWTPASMQGVVGNKLISMGAHASEAKTLAMGTDLGLYLSTDGGNRFNEALGGMQITSILFDRKDPEQVWIGGVTDHPVLVRFNMKTKQKEELSLPIKGSDDVVQFIAQQPNNPKQMAIVTFKKHIYVSSDGGHKWTQIVKEGQSIK